MSGHTINAYVSNNFWWIKLMLSYLFFLLYAPLIYINVNNGLIWGRKYFISSFKIIIMMENSFLIHKYFTNNIIYKHTFIVTTHLKTLPLHKYGYCIPWTVLKRMKCGTWTLEMKLIGKIRSIYTEKALKILKRIFLLIFNSLKGLSKLKI